MQSLAIFTRYTLPKAKELTCENKKLRIINPILAYLILFIYYYFNIVYTDNSCLIAVLVVGTFFNYHDFSIFIIF